ncbi:MAG: hypothetical protein COV31_02980 [Candidatus Yanofskybacteria bacterium CG10_big_fil_rev_8_21_14_0_10_46_23]|uniref:50S ribosomal protein L35 n=1 Tax=Candidatus Yanofskybacteria bacterium CG10_big_fil_rev_8_21_14_0_10_46_23 TaxID=1975098 RepID=A0A2H0R3N2_9BACT|nr:MAG: hypothetical protein COV31_02980 [Candidatus Yanofskybacteria bacterium CG10_big_fil_rev_8_21_14_0_10_46_23]
MTKRKSNRSAQKRVKITGKNKLLHRPPRQNHFNARANGNETREKRGLVGMDNNQTKDLKAII